MFGDMVLRRQRDLVGNVASWAVESISSGLRVTGFESIREKKIINNDIGLEVNPETNQTQSEAADSYLSAKDEDWNDQ